MRQILRAFQNRTVVTLQDRQELVQYLTAAGIAYGCPVPQGPADAALAEYRRTVMPVAMKVISAVNECFVVNTDWVLNLVRDQWVARYNILNSPIRFSFEPHLEPSSPFKEALIQEYNNWVEQFQQAAAAHIARGV